MYGDWMSRLFNLVVLFPFLVCFYFVVELGFFLYLYLSILRGGFSRTPFPVLNASIAVNLRTF